MSNMEPSGSAIPGVESSGKLDGDSRDFRYADGTLAGDITVHSTNETDGSIRAQLELRFENLTCAIIAPEIGVSTPGHSTGRTWVLVEVEPRQSYTDTLRFSIDIPGKPGPTSEDLRLAETATSTIDRASKAIAALRQGRGNPSDRDNLVHFVDALGTAWQLANDGSQPSVEPLAAQPLQPPSVDT
jgi:hypothetical protein